MSTSARHHGATGGPLALCSREDFTLSHYRRVAWDGEAVRFDDSALQRIATRRAQFMALLEDPEVVIYGVTSGYGQMAHLRFTAEERRAHARRPPFAAATGFGEPLPERVVRGILFARLSNFVEGHAAVGPDLAADVAAMLDGRPLPYVPLRGNGSAGEISALSYLFKDLAADRELGEKEALALINGSPCASALVADAALAARRRLDLAFEIFALSAEAILAPLGQLDPALDSLWNDPADAAAMQRLRGLMAGGAIERRPYQAPVSWRILPRMMGRTLRAVEDAEAAADRALPAVTDNPVFLPPDADHPKGRVLSNGGYHNAAAPACMDALSAGFANLATLADRHASKLLDGKVSLLPHQLITKDGYLGCIGFTALAFAEDARAACQPTLLPGSEGGGFGQNDVASPVFAAWRKQAEVAQAFESALACLAVIASQAFFATDRMPPPALRDRLEQVRFHVPPVDANRVMGPEIGALSEAFTREVVQGDAS